jgi:HEAT repeat protein
MRLWVTLGLLVALAAAVSAGTPSDGFVSLFNGRNLDGWVVAGNPEGFRVVDGCIHSDGGKGGQWIHTAKQYGNFVLRMEWMLSKVGNSGVFIRNGPAGSGFEVQLLAPWTPHRDDLHCTGSMYGFVPANPRPDETPLRWRTVEVTAEYKHVTVRIDGIICSEADYDQVPGMKDLALVGYVGMQDSHTGEGEWVRFRNIEIKDLDQDPAFVATGLAQDDPAVRRLAFDAAIRLGAPMTEPVLDMVKRGGAAQTHAGEMALGRIVADASAPGAEKEAAAVRGVLLARIEGKGKNDAPDRACAARLLGIVGESDGRTVQALTKALSAGGAVSAAALEAMQRIPGRAVTAALIEVLKQADATRQPALLLALGARRDETAIPALADAARTTSGDVRLAAVHALGVLGSAKAIPILRGVGTGAPDQLRQAVADALIIILDARNLDEAARLDALRAARELAVTDAQKRAVGAQ